MNEYPRRMLFIEGTKIPNFEENGSSNRGYLQKNFQISKKDEEGKVYESIDELERRRE